MPPILPDPEPLVATLANGVRVVAMPLAHLRSVHVSVFVKTGSRNESPRLNGISHVVEHMAFKGTHDRDCQRINLDAERLGAEVNAHTDKDHTAYHMRGLAGHEGRFLAMLGDIVRHSVFPEAELERERQVILHELTEDEDDPLSTAWKLLDRTVFRLHPLARPVIGSRRNIEKLSRADLLDYVGRQYTGCNVVVGVAGPIDVDEVLRAAEAAFGTMAGGVANAVEAPKQSGGTVVRRQSGVSQSHLLLAFPIPALAAQDVSASVAATLFGAGMSSPLMDELRERRGLVYYGACSADVMDLYGQFVVEASTAPEHVDEFFAQVMRLLRRHAESIDAVALERAKNQLAVRRLHREERPFQRLEDAVLDLFALGRVRPREELVAQVESASAEGVRTAFARLLAEPVAAAAVGKLRGGAEERLQAALRTA